MLRSDEGYREAFFWEYCSKCKYGDLKENEHPCCCCLDEPLNMESHKPVKWEGKAGYEDWVFKPENIPTE